MRRGRLLGSWLSNRFWLVLLVLLAFALRLYRLGFQSLRGDEALSVLYSARGFSFILDITKQTSRHPPLHYSLLNLWMLLVGKSEFSVRFLFLFFGVLALPLTLYWQAQQEMSQDYTIFTHLIDEEGQIWAQKDNQPKGGGYPTSLWDEGEVVKDEYELRVKEGTPPGEYLLEVGMYLLSTGERLPLLEGGKVVGDRILLGEVTVRGEESGE